jgi:hypothetical protein
MRTRGCVATGHSYHVEEREHRVIDNNARRRDSERRERSGTGLLGGLSDSFGVMSRPWLSSASPSGVSESARVNLRVFAPPRTRDLGGSFKLNRNHHHGTVFPLAR